MIIFGQRQMSLTKQRWHQFGLWIAGILLFAYVFIRAYNVPMTIDEATTFLVYVQIPLKDVFLNNPVNTNNHFLNSLAIRASTAVFGDSDFSVRLPSLLGYILYLIFSFKLLCRISSRGVVIFTGVALLHLNPYFIEFFGLARGYSLSWGFMMGSMYYLYRYIESRNYKSIVWSFLLAGLSVYSILIALNYFLALIVAFNFIFLNELRGKEEKTGLSFLVKKNIPAVVVSVVLFALLAYPVSRIRTHNEFYGERGSFYNDTLLSIVKSSFYGKKYFGSYFPDVVLLLAILIFIVTMVYAGKRFLAGYKSEQTSGALLFGLLFTITCLSTVAQFHFLGTPYLSGRTALILFPLFSILLVFSFSFWVDRKRLQLLLCLIPFCFYSFHFVKSANTDTVREWWFDMNTKDVIKDFLNNEDPPEKVSFAMAAFNAPSFHYYEKVWQLEDRLEMVRKDKLAMGELYDYYYLEQNVLDQISVERYEEVKKYDTRVLLRLKTLK